MTAAVEHRHSAKSKREAKAVPARSPSFFTHASWRHAVPTTSTTIRYHP